MPKAGLGPQSARIQQEARTKSGFRPPTPFVEFDTYEIANFSMYAVPYFSREFAAFMNYAHHRQKRDRTFKLQSSTCCRYVFKIGPTAAGATIPILEAGFDHVRAKNPDSGPPIQHSHRSLIGKAQEIRDGLDWFDGENHQQPPTFARPWMRAW